jgi:putative membrane protein
MEKKQPPPLTEYFANEQTYLSWLRTGAQVMAFGFVAIKFSLFASQVIGIVLVGVGTLMTLLSYLRYLKTNRQIREGDVKYSTVILSAVTIVLLIISIILIYCLMEAYFKDANKIISTVVQT